MKLYTREDYEKVKQTTLADKGASQCPFCEREDDLVIWEGDHWFVKHNKYPIGGRNDCLLVIPKRCVEFTKNLHPVEMNEFPEIEKFMTEFYKDHEDYWSMIRQRSHVKSIIHLHYHYLPGEIDEGDIQAIFDRQNLESNI